MRQFSNILKILLGVCSIGLSSVTSGQSVDRIKFDYNSFKKSDTLKIVAFLTDCGEWGGHYEYIIIFRKHNNFYGNLKRDSPCRPGMDILEGTPHFCFSVKLNKEFRNDISIFIANYNKEWLRTDNSPICCGGIEQFSIYFQNQESFFKCLDGHWKEFINLRNKIFKKEKTTTNEPLTATKPTAMLQAKVLPLLRLAAGRWPQ
jgi:hypothetical protein